MIRFRNKIFITGLAVFPLLLSCSDSSEDFGGEVRYSDVQIIPSAHIVNAELTRADFEGPVNNTSFTPSSEKIFGVTAYLDFDVPTSWVKNSRIYFSPVNSDAQGNYHFEESKYYPIDYRTYFYAFSPMVHCDFIDGNETEHPKVEYTLTGREDVMWSKNERGFLKAKDPEFQEQPDFLFEHKLQRVNFYVKRTSSVPSDWKVTEISITNLRNKATLDLITGDLVFDEDAPLVKLAAANSNYSFTPTTDAYQKFEYDIMFQPGITSFKLNLVIGDNTFEAPVVLTGEHAGEAGYMHTLYITIDIQTLTLSQPVLVPWVDELSYNTTL